MHDACKCGPVKSADCSNRNRRQAIDVKQSADRLEKPSSFHIWYHSGNHCERNPQKTFASIWGAMWCPARRAHELMMPGSRCTASDESVLTTSCAMHASVAPSSVTVIEQHICVADCMPATRVNARHVGPQVAVVHHGKCSRPRGKMRLNCMRGELEQTEQTRTNSNKPSVPCSTRVSWPHHGARFPTTPFLTILVVFRVALVDFPLLISTLPRIPPSPCGLPAGHCPPSATDARVQIAESRAYIGSN